MFLFCSKIGWVPMYAKWLRGRLLVETIQPHEQSRWKSVLSRLQPLTRVDKSTTLVSHGSGHRPSEITQDHRNKPLALPCEQGKGRGRTSADIPEEALRGNVDALREARSEGEAIVLSEQELAALACALIGRNTELTPAEEKLRGSANATSRKTVTKVRAMILAGEDALGSQFCRLRAPEERRTRGAIYTPRAVVDVMTAWAKAERSDPERIVDPGVGSGRFLSAAAATFPMASLVGVDIDPLATLMLRANAAVRGFADRLTVKLLDYRELDLDPIAGKTLFIGNPPYVRHHDIERRWKEWLVLTARRYNIKASTLAGLHVHFFLKTREIARPGDFGVFITAAEWLDVNYGSAVRQMLADGLGGTAIHILGPRAEPFEGVMATGAITCFRVNNRPATFIVRAVETLADLRSLNEGKAIDWNRAIKTERWSSLTSVQKRKPTGFIELGELFRVHRGQVTGSNATWIENFSMAGIPDRYFHPSVTRARELIQAGDTLRSAVSLRRVLDLPADLSVLSASERETVDRFLKRAKAQRIHEGYIAAHRRAWWAVELRQPAPILCTYMARSAPTYVSNIAKARHLNIAHGLYPLISLTQIQISKIVAYLRRSATTEGGRMYAGGLVKFEPRELERLRIPVLEQLDGYIADPLDNPTVASRRGCGERYLSQ